MDTLHRPDRSLGVFETLLVRAGAAVELGAHLDRLGASVAALYGAKLPPKTAETVARRAAGLSRARLRLTAFPAGGAIRCEAVAEPLAAELTFPGWTGAAALVTQTLAGGLGAHKWADRSHLERLGSDPVPLLLDLGGEVLEAAWGNLFCARDGALETPVADGRILPGVTRAAVLDIAAAEGLDAVERSLSLEQLREADEIFLTGSLRGVVPVRSIDGRQLRPGELSRAVAASLRRRWLAARATAAAR